MSPREYIEQQLEIWAHLPFHAKWDQVEAHCESAGYHDVETQRALDDMYEADRCPARP